MRAKALVVALCMLIVIFASLTLTVKQYAVVWWAAIMVSVITAGAIVVSKRP